MKFKVYKGETLHDALVTLKIDGVRAHRTETGVVSRQGKPLYNVQLECDVAEVFCGSWEATVSAVRTVEGTPVAADHVYSLSPTVDDRLVLGKWDKLDSEQVAALFEIYRGNYEGLVIHTKDAAYKVKGKETYDVKVTGVQPGTGKHKGRMGALFTPMGKVGTGFTDADRALDWPEGAVIEVECMELTPSGKFRHPRFVRRRFDKEA